jgi:hypothetical protein
VSSAPPKPQVVIPFVCPICAGANAVHLITLSRAGGMGCEACGKWLRSADVMRAMHAPRSGRVDAETPAAQSAPVRAAKDAAPVWPPTPESRAAIKPLYNRRRG